MQLQQIRYFLEIARTGNISAAARNLYVSQPSLSQQVLNLEAELGIQLLVRHSKSVSLTDAGEQFAYHGRRIVGETEQLTELMQKNSMLHSGTLRIGLLWIAGYVHVLEILKNYRRLHPGLHYSLKIDGSSALLKMLLERSIHTAFIISSEERLSQQENLYYRKIQDDLYAAVISRQNPLSREKALGIDMLKGQKVIMPAPASAFRRQVEQIFEAQDFTPDILCETSQSDLVIQLAAQNLGVGFASRSIAEAHQTDEFAIVPLQQPIIRSIFYVTLKELLDYPSIESFTEYLNTCHIEPQKNFSKIVR